MKRAILALSIALASCGAQPSFAGGTDLLITASCDSGKYTMFISAMGNIFTRPDGSSIKGIRSTIDNNKTTGQYTALASNEGDVAVVSFPTDSFAFVVVTDGKENKTCKVRLDTL